jgi:hypothetical protein
MKPGLLVPPAILWAREAHNETLRATWQQHNCTGAYRNFLGDLSTSRRSAGEGDGVDNARREAARSILLFREQRPVRLILLVFIQPAEIRYV